MALQFDGGGLVTIPEWSETGDFLISGTTEYKDSAIQVFLGDINGPLSWLAVGRSAGNLGAKTNGSDILVGSYTTGDTVIWEWKRIGTTVTFTVDGVAGTVEETGTVILNVLGTYNGGALPYEGLMSGILTMSGDNNATRTYNMDGVGTTLVDTTSAQNGTLSGFTSGGFTALDESISITSLSNDQCRQRDGSGNATFTVAGTVTGATAVEYTINGSTWLTLDASPTTTFTGNVVINGEVDLSVRLSNAPAQTDTKLRLKAAACVAFWWQSNEAGRVENLFTPTVTGNNPTPSMYKGGVFSVLADPMRTEGVMDGSIAARMAQSYSDQGIPICFANVAVGGTRISLWKKGGANYTKIQAFHDDCGGLEFTASIGGESDAIQETNIVTFESDLTGMLTDLNTDFGTNHYLTYFPSNGSNSSIPIASLNNVRGVFDTVISGNAFVFDGGDLQVIDISSTTNAANDDIHVILEADAIAARDIRLAAFPLAAAVSTLNLLSTGTPDGSYTADTYNNTTKLLIETKSLTFSGGSSSTILTVNTGTETWTLIEGSNAPVTGMAYIGVTE